MSGGWEPELKAAIRGNLGDSGVLWAPCKHSDTAQSPVSFCPEINSGLRKVTSLKAASSSWGLPVSTTG